MFYFTSIPIFNGYLILGYTTVYTMFPVLSIILDEDVSKDTVKKFPNLYKILQKGRSFNLKTFLVWIFKSVCQGSMIMICSIMLFEFSFLNIVSITYTSLIIVEILNVYLSVSNFIVTFLF